jgi:hypothetical protein
MMPERVVTRGRPVTVWDICNNLVSNFSLDIFRRQVAAANSRCRFLTPAMVVLILTRLAPPEHP